MRYVRFSLILLVFLALAASLSATTHLCARCQKPITSGTYIQAGGNFYHSGHFTCARCGRPIGTATYQEHDGQFYDSACYVALFHPRCAYCGQTIVGKFIEVGQQKYHESCYLDHVADRCAICGLPISGAYLYDSHGSKVHAEHLGEAKQCTYCSRLISPASKGGVTYPDGRVVCGICLESVVDDRSEADSLVQFARNLLAQQGIIIGLKKIPYEIVSKSKMTSLGPAHDKAMQGYTKLTQKQGLFGLVKDNEVRVYILEKLPKWNFVATAAHELMHVWFGVHNRFDTDETLAEGSCNYAAYLVLKQYEPESGDVLSAMMTDKDPVYGLGFRKAKEYAESVGTITWLQYVSTNDQPPW